MAKRPKKLTEETLMKLRQRMVVQASVKRDPYPEEVANEYVARLLEGLHKKSTVHQAYIDIKRTQMNLRSKYAEAILSLEHGQANSEALGFLECKTNLSMDEKIDLKRILSQIQDERTRWIFVQVLKGWTYQDIATELKLSLARVQQIVTRQIEDLKDQV